MPQDNGTTKDNQKGVIHQQKVNRGICNCPSIHILTFLVEQSYFRSSSLRPKRNCLILIIYVNYVNLE